MSGRKRLVTFLGTGNYTPIRYYLGETVCEPTRFFACALAQLRRPDEILVLATEKAEAHHGAALQEALGAAGLPAPVFERLPDGADASELWAQFDVLKKVLRAPPGTRILLDITHGFRTQPFFAAGAVSFVRAVDRTPCPIEVHYGAYEARTPQTIRASAASTPSPVPSGGDEEGADPLAPVWDLTPFVELTDWSQALRLFLLTGRTSAAMEGFVESAEKTLVREWVAGGRQGDKPGLHGLAKAFADFSADMATVRTGDLLLGRRGASSARHLLAKIDAARPLLEEHLPPLADVLDEVRDFVEPLVLPAGVETLASPEGHAALAALAQMYLGFERYLEAATTAQEGHVTRYGGEAAGAPGPRGGCTQEARAEASGAFREAEPLLFREVSDIRNDVNHGGYRSQPAPAATLRRRIGELVESFAGAERVEAPPVAATPRLFLNLSNHPSATWETPQRREAEALAGGPVVDVAFPEVDPRWSVEDVERVADEVVAGLPPASHALVMGEMTMTWALVQRLKSRGVVCLATTSRRDVEMQTDGGRLSRFVFETFRAYP